MYLISPPCNILKIITGKQFKGNHYFKCCHFQFWKSVTSYLFIAYAYRQDSLKMIALGGGKEINMHYIHIPNSHKECKHNVLLLYTDKFFKNKIHKKGNDSNQSSGTILFTGSFLNSKYI